MKTLLTPICALTLLISACNGSLEAPPDTPITGINYIGATVSNLEQTTALYSSAADLKDVQSLEISGVNAFDKFANRDVKITSKMLRSVNAQMRYMEFDDTSKSAAKFPAVPVNGTGIAHVCFQVNGETKTYEKFLSGGAKSIGAPEMVQLSSRNPVRYAYIHDPDNMVVEVEHVDVAALELETPPKHDYRIRHVSLATPDMKRAVAFYAYLLGDPKPRQIGRLRPIGVAAMSDVSGLPGTKVKMSWFQLRNLELEIIEYVSPPPTAVTEPRLLDAIGYNMIVFDVTNLAEAHERFVEAGGTIVSEPEILDGGEILFGRDPDGNLIGLQHGANSIVSSQQFKNNGIEG